MVERDHRVGFAATEIRLQFDDRVARRELRRYRRRGPAKTTRMLLDALVTDSARGRTFLDVGGGASPERVQTAFNLVLSDRNVKAILVNIFAGINRCDWVAEGVVQAVKKIDLKIPLVVRLSGTNVNEGRRILRDSGLPIIMADTLAEAAEKAVAAWKSTAK